MIREIWFGVLALMLTVYAVLDGFDLGVGVMHLFVGRSDDERGLAIEAIGPVWNGNEVWLLAAGGAMVVAFPRLYAAAFSGFYLALMLVLWLLILRGLAIEFRHQVHNPLWHQACDVTFSVASILLSVLFGVALGNVLHGVPLDLAGQFQGAFAVLLNPFSILGGVLGLAVLGLHGSLYLAVKTAASLQARARRAGGAAWWLVAALVVAMVAASFPVRPDFAANFFADPVLFIVPLAIIVGLAAIRIFWARQRDLAAFVASAATIVGIMASVAVGLFPRLLPTVAGSAAPSLDIYNSAGPLHSLRIALGLYVVGMVIVAVYLVRIYRVWRGKVGDGKTYGV